MNSSKQAALFARLCRLAAEARSVLPPSSTITAEIAHSNLRSSEVAANQVSVDVAHCPGFSNWLIPRALCLGRYPYPVTPRGSAIAAPPLESCQKHLHKLVQQENVSTFISMQAEIPPSFAEGTFNGKFWTDLSSGATFSPYFDDALSFATVRDLPSPEFLHFPVIDLSVPSHEMACNCLDAVLTRLASRKAVYLHCYGGRGRAGTMGALLLALLYPALGATAALELVERGCRARLADPLAVSPETVAQIEFVHNFSEKISRYREMSSGLLRSKL